MFQKLRVISKRVTVILAAILLCLMTHSKITTGQISICGYMPMLVMSESMEPTIKTHQLIIGIPFSSDDVQEGDIVTYKLRSKISDYITKSVTHRIVAINEDETIICKGDNNPEPDKPITADMICYKIIYY